MQAAIYWLRHKNHTNLFTEGYVGVSCNVKERLRHHFKNAIGGYHSDKSLSKAIVKYEKDNIEQEIVLIADEKYCYEIEAKLRPKAFIGWNMREGGYHTPNPYPSGSKRPLELTIKAMQKIAELRQNQSIGKDRKVIVNGQTFNRIKDAREAFGISSTQMKRILKGVTYDAKSKGNTKFSHLEIRYADS